jgi:hypothetical protein
MSEAYLRIKARLQKFEVCTHQYDLTSTRSKQRPERN